MHDQGDGLPPALVGAHPQRDGVPRLLAADVLHQRGRGRRVLGVPREGGGDGPLAAAQVGDPRPRRRGARAARGHARHPPARRRPGRLHRGVQRDRRHDRRRDRVPARRTTTSASSAATSTTACTSSSSPSGSACACGSSRRPTSCTTSPSRGRCSREILKRDRLDARRRSRSSRSCKWFRFLIGRIGDYQGIPVVVSRTGYSGELGYEVFCHPADGPAVWDAIMAAGAPHGLKPLGLDALDMLRIEAGPDLRRLRVRRPGRPVRGGHRLHRQARLRRRLPRQGRRSWSARRTRSAARRARAGGQRDRPATATACTSGRRQVGVDHVAARAARCCARTSRCAAWPSSTPSSARRSRSASSTATRSGSRRPSCGSRSTTRRRRRPQLNDDHGPLTTSAHGLTRGKPSRAEVALNAIQRPSPVGEEDVPVRPAAATAEISGRSPLGATTCVLPRRLVVHEDDAGRRRRR